MKRLLVLVLALSFNVMSIEPTTNKDALTTAKDATIELVKKADESIRANPYMYIGVTALITATTTYILTTRSN